MLCPYCGAPNEDETENCFHCGKGLFTLTEGTLLHSRYEILKPLGRGGMGMVYKAHDRELDEVVAVKLLRADLARSADVARRFRSEIKLARKVRHRNVCGIHEYGQEGHLKYILMEYVEGEDLKQVIRRRGALPAEEACEIALQAARGLQAIHDAGIIHRDLKTPNMMLDAQGVVRLMDFGIAKQFDTEVSGPTGTGHVVGTPEYMSPEQARAERVDARSDLYALGVVIYELFTGVVPFRGDTPVATMLKQIQEPPLQAPEAETLPPAIRAVLARLLAKDRGDRFGSAREVIDALREARQRTFPEAAGPPRKPMAVAGALAQRTEVLPTPVPTPVPALTPPPADPTSVMPAAPPPSAARQVPPGAPSVRQGPRPGVSARRAQAPPRAGLAASMPRWVVVAAAAAGLGAALLWLGGRQRERSTTALSPTDQAMPVAQQPVLLPSASRSTPEAAAAPRHPDPLPSPSSTPAGRRSLESPSVRPDASAARPDRPAARADSPPERPDSPASRAPSAAPVEGAHPVPPIAAPGSPAAQGPKEPAAETGLLRVVVRPYAEVSIDGRVVGSSPPLAPITLSAGVHTVELRHPDYRPLHKRVTVRPGETTRLEVDLTQEAFRK